VTEGFTNAAGTVDAFVPSLGLYDRINGEANNANQADTYPGQQELTITGVARNRANGNINEAYPIGADCIGFAQRAAGYRGNRYTWPELSFGWTEGGDLDPGDGGREYPRDDLTAGSAGRESRSVLIADADTLPPSGDIRGVVPGDVFFYGDDPGNLEHIGIVRAVTYGEDGWANIGSITLIESTYSDDTTVQSVIGKRRVGAHAQDPTAVNYADTRWHLVRLRVQ
jgi:hypothetical protein